MELQSLLKVLEHGEKIILLDNGEEVSILRPPTRHTIQAAKTIKQLLELLNKTVQDNATLFKLLTPTEQKEFENVQ